MSEEDWGDIETVDTKPARFPKWLLFCGGGCLLMVVLLIAAGAFLFPKLRDMADEEVQYPKLERYIEIDERLAGARLQGFQFSGTEVYIFSSVEGRYSATFQVTRGAEEQERWEAMFAGTAPVEGFEDAQTGTVTVQGRELRVVRATMTLKFPLLGKVPGTGPTVMVDLGDVDSDASLVLIYTRPGNDEPVADQELIDFLEPFHVGPDRPPAPEPEAGDGAPGGSGDDNGNDTGNDFRPRDKPRSDADGGGGSQDG